MKKIVLFLLFVSPFCVANMAKPYIDGSKLSAIYGDENASVTKELISIKVFWDTESKQYLANYTVTYFIESETNQELPLLFVARYLYQKNTILVNTISTNFLPYVDYLNGKIRYKKEENLPVNREDLLYFKANLQKGKNTVEIKYTAKLKLNTTGFRRSVTTEYDIFPSRYWQSFGPIILNMQLPEELEITNTNLKNFSSKSYSIEYLGMGSF
jgi:hypothetical protein